MKHMHAIVCRNTSNEHIKAKPINLNDKKRNRIDFDATIERDEYEFHDLQLPRLFSTVELTPNICGISIAMSQLPNGDPHA